MMRVSASLSCWVSVPVGSGARETEAPGCLAMRLHGGSVAHSGDVQGFDLSRGAEAEAMGCLGVMVLALCCGSRSAFNLRV